VAIYACCQPASKSIVVISTAIEQASVPAKVHSTGHERAIVASGIFLENFAEGGPCSKHFSAF
jgi:hypothetical protein